MRDELSAIAGPILARIKEHPFWDSLRKGTLPAASLWRFAEQDARYVVPTYARALAHTAAIADHDSHGAILCAAANSTFDAVTRMADELTMLAEELGKPAATAVAAPIGPLTHAHTSFMLAAPTTSFAAGIGGLLPMTWFHLKISSDLKERRKPESHYVTWIDQYCPGDGYQDYVETYLNMVDEVSEQCSAGERAQLTEHFMRGACYEWAFADAAWRCPVWSV